MAVKLMQQKQEREDSKENLTSQDTTETINKIKERSNPQTLTSLTYSSDGNHCM
jgi:hypothetical protein